MTYDQRYVGTNFDGEDFRGDILSGTFTDCDFQGADLSGAVLKGKFVHCDFRTQTFHSANREEAIFIACKLPSSSGIQRY